MPPAQPIRDYPAGQIIPGTVYKVLRHIATGGMGTVYDVEDTSVGKRYVLKTLHPELGDRQDLARRMIKEARTLAQLHHPNIVEVFTAGMTKDDLRLPYYVMERLDGQSLRTVLEKRKSLELLHTYEIGIDLLDALDCAHDKSVIHRDVKPDNIFLHRAPNGSTVTKLLDFGIMRVLDGAKGETAGRFLGTLRYSAPEQLRGDHLGPRTDLYAAALVIYEMLAGRGPFDEEKDIHEIGNAHIGRPAPPLSTFARVPVPRELEALIASALEKDPAARPRDALTFAKALRALAHAQNPNHGHGVNTTSRPTAIDVLGAHSRMHDPRSVPEQVRAPHAPTALSPQAPALQAPQASQSPTPFAPMSLELEGGRTVRGMTPPPLQGGTLEDAPLTSSAFSGTGGGVPPTAPATLASAGAQSAPPSVAGPRVDRGAATHSLAYEVAAGTPRNGTEALTPPIAVTPSADPYGRTQRALGSVPPPSVPVQWSPPAPGMAPPGFTPASPAALPPPGWPPRASAASAPPSVAARMETTGPVVGGAERAYRIVGIIAAVVAVVSLVAVVVLLVMYRARLSRVGQDAPAAADAPLASEAPSSAPAAAPPVTGAPANVAPVGSGEVPSVVPAGSASAGDAGAIGAASAAARGRRTGSRREPGPTATPTATPTGDVPRKLPSSGL